MDIKVLQTIFRTVHYPSKTIKFTDQKDSAGRLRIIPMKLI